MRLFSVAEFLSPRNGHRPTTAERRLIEAAQAGRKCNLCAPGPDRRPDKATDDTSIRAELLRFLILGGSADCGLHERGIFLVGGWIEGKLDLDCCHVRGMIVLHHCHFTERIDARVAKLQLLSLDESLIPGLYAPGVEVMRDISLRDADVTDTISLFGARLEGKLDCDGASLAGANLDGKGKKAILAQRMTVKQGFYFRRIGKIDGIVDLTAAHVGDLIDEDMSGWPKDFSMLVLDGFTYDRLSKRAPYRLTERRDWLEAGSHYADRFQPQPYTQLAKVLRQMGHPGEARKVLVKRGVLAGKERRAARLSESKHLLGDDSMHLVARTINCVDWLADSCAWAIASYGHSIRGSLIGLFLLFLSATTLAHFAWVNGDFAPNSDVVLTSAGWAEVTERDCFPVNHGVCDQNPAQTWANTFTVTAASPTRGADWESFNRYGYAADLVIPFLDLGQNDAWAPSKDRGDWGRRLWWARWVLEFLGWVFASLFVAITTGILQRNQPD